ncbi:MAG: SACE_7040 family transcriptional regulator [Pseudonocardiaceae bacterium]
MVSRDTLPDGRAARTLARREEILAAAAALFAERGFHGVTIEDIGRSVGITGPGLYRHFPSKDAVLAQVLIGVSERLVAGGRDRVASAEGAAEALDALLAGHIAFALSEPALITVHDRELGNVPEADRRTVRRLQRRYLEQWVDVLAELTPDAPRVTLRAATHATFGLLNSTPHSAGALDQHAMARLLHGMAQRALHQGSLAGAGAHGSW